MNMNEMVSCGGAGRAALPSAMPSPVSRLASSEPNRASAWRFPFGTNEYDSAWAFSWGKLRFALGDAASEIVAVGAPMAAVPYHSRLWTAVGTNGSRLVTWENFALGRDTSAPVNAQIELRITGDFVTRSNAVETVYHRVDDFDWDGDGIPNWSDGDPRWYDGDFTGQDDGWREYVDECVGTGLENGYYKLTATFPAEGFRRTVLAVGDEEVVVAAPGEYVFLLEKGEDYEFDVEPFSPHVSFAAVDDIPLVISPLMLSVSFGWWTGWTVDGGEFVFEVPSFMRPGHCRWMPTFQATPSISHLGPGDSPQTFTAVLSDYAYARAVQYEWRSDDGNVSFSNPYSEETEIFVDEMPSWRSSSVTVTATVGGHSLESTCSFTYGEHETPQVSLELSAPAALLLNSNNVDSAKIGQADISFASDVKTNGTVRVYCSSGGGRVRLIGSCAKSVTEEESFSVEIEGVEASEALGDVTLCAAFAPDGEGESVVARSTLTVVQVNDVVLPGAPNDGLVISTGTSVAIDLDVFPDGAEELLSVIYNVRRLRGDGTYTDWEFAAGNYRGTDAIYNPQEGGIYQVQAYASLGWGAGDERYYVWEDDSDYLYGLNVSGDMKAFGVCDEEWQKRLRNCAKSYIGNTEYALDATLSGRYGYSSTGSGDNKCNYFVAYRVRETGLLLGVQHERYWRDYPPTANDWANGVEIDDWEHLSNDVFVQPGFVVGHPATRHGHCGIVDFDGWVIAAGKYKMNRKYDEWLDGTSGYNKLRRVRDE